MYQISYVCSSIITQGMGFWVILPTNIFNFKILKFSFPTWRDGLIMAWLILWPNKELIGLFLCQRIYFIILSFLCCYKALIPMFRVCFCCGVVFYCVVASLLFLIKFTVTDHIFSFKYTINIYTSSHTPVQGCLWAELGLIFQPYGLYLALVLWPEYMLNGPDGLTALHKLHIYFAHWAWPGE